MKTKVFLDSGAFSAWNQKVPLRNEDYIDYAQERRDKFSVVAGLDMIPGTMYKTPTQAEVDMAAATSWDNAMAMRRAGIPCLPTYHMGEDRKHLCRMLSGEFDYIALGTTGSLSIRERQEWLDDLFANYLTDDNGYPVIKTHGFAVFCDHAYRYPWYSCDSTTPRIWASMGLIFLPKKVDGKYDYTVPFEMGVPSEAHIKEAPKTMVGEASQTYGMRKAMVAHEFDKVRIDAFARDELDMDFELLKTDAKQRYRANIITALRVERGITQVCDYGERRLSRKIKIAAKAKNGFWHKKPEGIITEGLKFRDFKYYFASGIGRSEHKIYTELGVENRLISYYYLTGAGRKHSKYDHVLDEIVETGVLPDADDDNDEAGERT